MLIVIENLSIVYRYFDLDNIDINFWFLFIVVGTDSDLEGGQVSGNDDNSGKLFDDEKEGVAYSWSFYHFTFAMATLF